MERTAYLTGDTYQFRGRLKDAGWTWDPKAQAWTKQGEWESPSDVIRNVRRIGGIRNRGEFEAEIR